MKTEFKVGDIVEGFGVRGEVLLGDNQFIHLPVLVKFDGGAKRSFTSDGRLGHWCKEPSLKLIERKKERVLKERFEVQDKLGLKQGVFSIYEEAKAFILERPVGISYSIVKFYIVEEV